MGATLFLSTPSARRATCWQSSFAPSRVFLSTPSARRATGVYHAETKRRRFLSTPSARRATEPVLIISTEKYYFYPRPPRGGRRMAGLHEDVLRDFYPRPPRGGRRIIFWPCPFRTYFYPRPPRGGRRLPSTTLTATRNFYPRPPRGGRPLRDCGSAAWWRFLSTPSARRATVVHGNRLEYLRISIHALREEGDRQQGQRREDGQKFLSTPSARRAT